MKRTQEWIQQHWFAGLDLKDEYGFRVAALEASKLLVSSIYANKLYHIYRKNLSEYSKPVIPDGYTMRILDATNTFDSSCIADLVKEGYDFSTSIGLSIAKWFLGDGCIGFMLFHDKHFVAEAWILTYDHVRAFCDITVAEEGLSFVGGVETIRKYRARGLQHYLLNRVFEHLYRTGYTSADMIVQLYSNKSVSLWRSLGCVPVQSLVQRTLLGHRRWVKVEFGDD